MASTAMSALSGSATGNKSTAAATQKRTIEKIKADHNSKLARVKAYGVKVKENGAAGMGAVITLAEVDGFAFMAAVVEGYFGSDRIKVFSVPAHAGIGAAMILWGLLQTFNGTKGAQHYIAIGTGLTAPTVVGWGLNAGRKWAEGSPSKSASGASNERKITMTEAAPAQASSGTRRVRRP